MDFLIGKLCKPLSSPSNGAISCDKWLFGTQCQMHCQDNYDIPAVDTGFNGIFTCSDMTGVFLPINTAPNCTGKIVTVYLLYVDKINLIC